ncbi:MAG: aminopeptidase, partial [Flavobacteriales bacterium]|nr:aminopeptidase [Flavobacteriales bacterium]
MKLIQLPTLLFILLFSSCGVSEKEDVLDASIVAQEPNVCERIWSEDEIDYHTLSNYMDVYVSHIHLDVEISFDEKKLFGSATHTIENPCNKDIIVFDSRSLDITSITLNDGEEATYEIGELDELLGQSITVHINENTELVTINYSTTNGTRALDWLVPAQTAGKQNPFMYTQGQAVLTRTWLPCQDTPGRRITYSAKVKVPNHLMAVMSASNPTVKNESGVYDFEMN